MNFDPSRIVNDDMDPDQLAQTRVLAGQVAAWIAENYGDRCPEACYGCPCCDAWAGFDVVFGVVPPGMRRTRDGRLLVENVMPVVRRASYKAVQEP